MEKKILIIVDMQNDFVEGVIGSNEAREIVPRTENLLFRKCMDKEV